MKRSLVKHNPQYADRLSRQLARLSDASGPDDMNLPGWHLHPLKGNRAGSWAVSVSGNWRLTFRFDGTDAVAVNYEDYH
ncbi:MAG: type II toxin-antitoxin system RelE/ParE family toxin [Pseudomonadota bacterium]|nr:type II toxin-antitoxin system RelE/ParE family toxin [Pseudomonadota bacterium]